MISSLCSRINCLNGYRGLFLKGCDTYNNLGLSFPSMFIGEYVRKAIQIINEGSQIDKINWLNNQWKRMTNVFSNGPNGLAVVDTDISISDDKLFLAVLSFFWPFSNPSCILRCFAVNKCAVYLLE